MEIMTVKELKELLNRYNDNQLVRLSGGEGCYGEWAMLEVGEYKSYSFLTISGEEATAMEFSGETIWEN